jgi:protease I
MSDFYKWRHVRMELNNKKIAIFVAKMFEDIELLYPYYRMIEEGAEVHLVGSERGHIYDGKHGISVKTDISIYEIKAEDYDCLIIPGGFGPDYMRRDYKFIEFTKKMNNANKWIAAICHGPWILASAEIINGKKITGFISIRDDLRHAGARVVEQDVVVDGNIITSRSPQDLPSFARTIIQHMSGRILVGGMV